jgi:hypothetical protein
VRKLLIAGLGAVATVTLALGPASPARAVIVSPGMASQVCNSLPASLASVLNGLVANGLQTGLINIALTTATADLTNKTTDLVNAMVTHIQTVDAGGNVASTLAVVNARIPAYADSAAVWVAKWHELDTAQLQAQNLVMQQGVLNGLTSGLCVL